MYKILCPVCRSSKVMKNGKRNGVQLYICGHCRHQFRNLKVISKDNLWEMYSAGKQTVLEIAESVGVSESTIKRQLCTIVKEWKQPPLSGEGYVHIDATYGGAQLGRIGSHRQRFRSAAVPRIYQSRKGFGLLGSNPFDRRAWLHDKRHNSRWYQTSFYRIRWPIQPSDVPISYETDN